MGKKLTTEQFIEKARLVHGDKYDYSKTFYNKMKENVCIICPEHGEFWQQPRHHLSGSNCPICNPYHSLDLDAFLQKSREVHGDKYDYSKVMFKGNRTKVCIICPIHGEFWQLPPNHMRGSGCPFCADEKQRDTKEEFISKATKIHGDRYDYSKVKYVNSQTKVCIVCKEHGEFWQKANDHVQGRGCPICSHMRPSIVNEGFIKDLPYISSHERVYICWHAMVSRCNSSKVHKKQPTYKDCEVCGEWRKLSSFKEWFDKHYVEGWALDKDILVKGNKIYSPQTCCFVPQEINTLFAKRQGVRGEYPIGVSFCKNNQKFRAQIHKNGKMCGLGYYKTPEEAFHAYKVAKEAYIKEVADKWKSKLDPKVYEVIYNYEVEITD